MHHMKYVLLLGIDGVVCIKAQEGSMVSKDTMKFQRLPTFFLS